MTLLLISFAAGVLTVLAPCILPLLPVIVGGSVAGTGVSKRRALTVTLALGVSVIVFTLLLKVSTIFITIPEHVWSYISGGIIIVLGIVTIFPSIWEHLKFNMVLNRVSNQTMSKGFMKKSLLGDIIVGASLGPVFSTCSPTYFIVLATVLPVRPALGMLYLLSYVVGLCLSLLVIAIIGQKIMTRLNLVADPKSWFKKALGILFLIVGIGIVFGYDKALQTKILSSGFFDVTAIEQKLLKFVAPTNQALSPADSVTLENIFDDQRATSSSALGTSSAGVSASVDSILKAKSKKYPKAIELSTIDGYINTSGKPITIAEQKGKKVVLLDIWTYSCINCQRTIPYLNEWYEKYKDQGLEIIGLHTPEFGFEKVLANVQGGVDRLGIKYPVVLDNDYSTWRSYGNQYWPRKYLIDIDGYIIYDHIGEGGYDVTEKAIQIALKERADRLGISASTPAGSTTVSPKKEYDLTKVKSPEIYFGASRNTALYNGNSGRDGTQTLSIRLSDVVENKLYMSGTWDFQPEYAEFASDMLTGPNVLFKYNSKNVYMVASAATPVNLEVYQDGKLVKTISVKEETLYTLIENADYGKHTLELKVRGAGFKAFTFTFG